MNPIPMPEGMFSGVECPSAFRPLEPHERTLAAANRVRVIVEEAERAAAGAV